MGTYYLAVDGRETGPFEVRDLPTHGLAPDSMVWQEGMADWKEARFVPDVAALLGPDRGPPRMPPQQPPPAWNALPAQAPLTARAPWTAQLSAQAPPPYPAQPVWPPASAPMPYYPPAPVQMVNVQVGGPLIVPTKSVGVAFLLTFFFGPLGMLYSTVGGAIVMLIISTVAAVPTFGLSLGVTWPICILWGCLAASSYNTRVMAQARRW